LVVWQKGVGLKSRLLLALTPRVIPPTERGPVENRLEEQISWSNFRVGYLLGKPEKTWQKDAEELGVPAHGKRV